MSQTFRKKTYLNLLDIGSSKIACLVVRLTDNKYAEVVGASCVPATGIQAGMIWDLGAATACIGDALHQAEKQADHPIESVIVNISSPELHSLHLYHETAIPAGKPVSGADVKRLVDEIVSIHVPTGEEVLHAFPLGYVLDKEQGHTDPRGVYATTLGAHIHVVTLPQTQAMNLLTVLDRCHVCVEMKVATPYASALAVLSDEEKDIGSTVIDFGAGTTSYAVFVGGGLMQLGVIQMGSNQMTRDIALGLNTDLKSAERLKVLNGAAFLSPRDELESVIVPILGDEEGANMQVRRSDLIRVIVPRLEETLEKIGLSLEAETTFTAVAKRFVLTGCGSGLAGLKEKTASLLGGIARIGKTKQIKNLPSAYDSCTFNVCIGLLMYALMRRQDKNFESFQSAGMKQSRLRKGIEWIKQILS
ncbi:MAG: cell division protein FtsA [Alphaproteobacteria bacterium]